MKDKRIIAYKSERIKKIAYGLREVLVKSTMKEWSRLREEQKNRRNSRLKKIAIENERSVLCGALDDSICICSGCNQIKREMVYNAPLKAWYCTLCTQGYRVFYVKEFSKKEKDNFYKSFS